MTSAGRVFITRPAPWLDRIEIVKAKAEGSGTAYEAHVELPNPMPRNSMLWVEVQPANGKKPKQRLP